MASYEVVYVGRSRDTMAWLNDLETTHRDRLRIHVDDEASSLDVEALVGDIAAHPLRDDTELYMCGPIRLMDAVRRAWLAHGLPPTNLRFETFGNSGAWAPEEFVVRVPHDDVSVLVPKDMSILEALGDAGVEVMADCRKGECGLCTVRITSHTGRVDHRDVFFDDEQKASDTRLCLCVSRLAWGDAEPPPGAARLELVLEHP